MFLKRKRFYAEEEPTMDIYTYIYIYIYVGSGGGGTSFVLLIIRRHGHKLNYTLSSWFVITL